MNSYIVNKINEIMKINNFEDAKKSAIKLIVHIISIKKIDEIFYELLQKFVEFVFILLPSSNLPKILADKLGFKIKRKKKVIFNEKNTVSYLKNIKFLSLEGQNQRNRENKTLSIFNTDSTKNFKYTSMIESGESFNTVIVSLNDMNVENVCINEFKKNNLCFFDFKYNLEEIIKNHKLIDNLVFKY